MLHAWILASALAFSATQATATEVAVDQADDHLVEILGADPLDTPTPALIDPMMHFQQLHEAVVQGFNKQAYLQVHFDRLINFQPPLMQKLEKTKQLLNQLFSSERFRRAVLDHEYSGTKTFVQNNGYTNQQIYDVMHLGKEMLKQEIDGMMNLELQSYYENSTVVGYTYSNSSRIYVNRKFYSTYTPAQIARNLTHEWLHKIGFSHDFNATARRPYSVPYGIGNLVERVARQLK